MQVQDLADSVFRDYSAGCRVFKVNGCNVCGLVRGCRTVSSGRLYPRIRVAAIIQQGDSLLMVRHQKDTRSYWLLPGGGVDVGETLEQALYRELQEEANVAIQSGGLVFVNDAIAPDGSRHVVQCTFLADIITGEVSVGVDGRVVEVRFVLPDELGTLDIHPPLKSELLRGLEEGFAVTSHYLGNRWVEASLGE